MKIESKLTWEDIVYVFENKVLKQLNVIKFRKIDHRQKFKNPCNKIMWILGPNFIEDENLVKKCRNCFIINERYFSLNLDKLTMTCGTITTTIGIPRNYVEIEGSLFDFYNQNTDWIENKTPTEIFHILKAAYDKAYFKTRYNSSSIINFKYTDFYGHYLKYQCGKKNKIFFDQHIMGCFSNSLLPYYEFELNKYGINSTELTESKAVFSILIENLYRSNKIFCRSKKKYISFNLGKIGKKCLYQLVTHNPYYFILCYLLISEEIIVNCNQIKSLQESWSKQSRSIVGVSNSLINNIIKIKPNKLRYALPTLFLPKLINPNNVDKLTRQLGEDYILMVQQVWVKDLKLMLKRTPHDLKKRHDFLANNIPFRGRPGKKYDFLNKKNKWKNFTKHIQQYKEKLPSHIKITIPDSTGVVENWGRKQRHCLWSYANSIGQNYYVIQYQNTKTNETVHSLCSFSSLSTAFSRRLILVDNIKKSEYINCEYVIRNQIHGHKNDPASTEISDIDTDLIQGFNMKIYLRNVK